jgi:membrane-associated phospholipid phosphatase
MEEKQEEDPGNRTFPLVVCVLWVWAAAASGRPIAVVAWTAALVALMVALKAWTGVLRPDGTTRDSFPSGHAALAAFLSGCVVASLSNHPSMSSPTPLFSSEAWARAVLATLCATWTLAVGVARVTSRRHAPADVLAGWALGAAAAAAFCQRSDDALRT